MVRRVDPVGLLLHKVPELRVDLDVDDLASPYVVFGIAMSMITREPVGEDLVARVFDVLNELAEKSSPEIENLVQVGALERVADDDRLKQMAIERLSPRALRLLQRADAGWTRRPVGCRGHAVRPRARQGALARPT